MAPVTITVEPIWLVVASVVLAIATDGFKLIGCAIPIVAATYIYYQTTLLNYLQLACWEFLGMESKAHNLVAIVGSGPGDVDLILSLLNELKADIKHRQVSESAIVPLFDLVQQSILQYDFVEAGFSILGHLTKRLVLQEQKELLLSQGLNTLPSIVCSLGDQRDRIRQRAAQALLDFWHLASADVEQVIRDVALTSKIPKVKEAGMKWILKIKKEHDMQVKSFVPGLIECLEDADGSVRETAKATLVGLFRSIANDRASHDLQKGLQHRGVNLTIIVHILTELGVAIPSQIEAAIANHPEANSTTKAQAIPTTTSGNTSYPKPQVTSNVTPETKLETELSAIPTTKPQAIGTTHSQETGPSKKAETFHKSDTSNDPPPVGTTSVAEREAEQLEPAYVETARDLEDIFRNMQPCFEGKESEQNWSPREKSIVKLRKITKGNAPEDLTTVYLAGIRGLLDGILKTINSLRTTVSTNGCHLIQDIARVAGSGLDNMIEILLPNLIKLCANTKKISASNGNVTVDAILANVSYNIRLLQHIWNATQDKNVQPRTFAAGWLKTIITRHGQRKSVLEHAGGFDLMEKCIKAGLADRDKKVRESMRPTYWAFARICPEKSEHIFASLEKKQQELLIEDSSNPNPQKVVAPNTSMVSAQAPALSRSTTSVPAARPSIKEAIAAQKKRAKLASHRLPDRPGSADSAVPSSSKIKPSSTTVRPATAVGSLSSAPVRPFRTARKPDSTKQPAIAHAVVEQPVTEAPAVEVPAIVETLKVYEDPSPKAEKPPSPPLFQASKVLEELPANKITFNSLTAEGKWANTPEKAINAVSAHRLLESGIVRVRARTLDIHGFRKLQALIRSQDDIWSDDAKFEELLLPLLEFLEESNDESKPAKALDLKTQVLVTIQLMLKHQAELFSTFHPRTLCAILTARQYVQSTSHLVYGLEEMSKLIITRCEPEDCIDAVLDLLETEASEIHESGTLFMGMSVLERLLHRYAIPGKMNLLTSEQEIRMGKLATRCLAASSPDVRRAVVRYILELNDCIRNEPHFWKLIGSACDDYKDLLTYYIAKRAEVTVRYEL